LTFLGSDKADNLEILKAAAELLGRDGRAGTVRIRGTSMAPMLHPDQRVAVAFDGAEPRRGDLLLFRQADYLAVHRMLGAARPGPDGELRLRTRGDGQVGLDPPLNPADVLGRVTAIETDGGWRSLDGTLAGIYARCIARHDLFWAGVGVCARTVDRRLGRDRSEGLLSRWVSRSDRGLLTMTHVLLFRVCHPRVAGPSATGAPLAN
jgi:hypothetical protein